MKKLIIKWAIGAVSIYAAGYLVSGFTVSGWEAAIFAAAVFGVLNTIVRPVLKILTFPVTLLTLGLFLFVINGIMVYLLSELMSGIHVVGMIDAIIASVVISLITMVLNNVLDVDKK